MKSNEEFIITEGPAAFAPNSIIEVIAGLEYVIVEAKQLTQYTIRRATQQEIITLPLVTIENEVLSLINGHPSSAGLRRSLVVRERSNK